METSKDRKINMTCNLSITTIDKLEAIAKKEKKSRNALVEEAVFNLLAQRFN